MKTTQAEKAGLSLAAAALGLSLANERIEVMKQEYYKRVLALLFLLCCLSVTTVSADVTQEDLDNAREWIDNLQEQVEDAEEAIDHYNDKKDVLEENLTILNSNLQILAKDMNELEHQIAEKQQELKETAEELEEAEARSAQQYEDMKTRIRFMYENGNTSVFSMLLQVDSITDFLNQTEYITSINEYDREKLAEYSALQEEIAQTKAILEEEERVLLALQEEMQQNQMKVGILIAATEETINKTEDAIVDAQANKEALEEQLAYWEEYEKQLEIQKAKEDLARWNEIQGLDRADWAGVPYTPGDGEAYLLAAIIQCESEGEPYEGKLAVGSVVLNRVRSASFPNTITGVIYQEKQFSPVASGRLAYRLEAGVNEECKRAAMEVLDGKIIVNSLFFRTNNGIIQGNVIGNHVFY